MSSECENQSVANREKLISKINAINEEMKKDITIDVSSLDKYFNRHELIMKWTFALTKWKRVRSSYDHKVSLKYKEEYERYVKKSHYDVNSKEFAIIIKANQEYADIKEQLDLVDIAIENIKQMVSSLNGQSFEIKNYMEYQKFLKGIN